MNSLIVKSVLFAMALLIHQFAAAKSNLDLLKVPAGFKIELFESDVPNARTMVLGTNGTLFVGTRNEGVVYAIKNNKRYIIAEDLNMPNGLAFRDKALYIGAVDKLFRMDDIEARLDNPPIPTLIRDDLPSETHHGWRYMDFGPDGRLYMAIGAPCNVCLKKDYAVIRSMNADGTDERVEARGIRNTVGFTWHPVSKKLWLSDNGRDMMGDDIPPDEINRVDEFQEHFGFPYCHGGTIADPEFNDLSCRAFTPPIQALGAHVAPLGIAFYTGKQFPKAYKNRLFVAEHGSWNRSKKSGYKVMMATITGSDEDEIITKYEPFVTGWLQGQKAWGRPAYVLVLKDGSLLISDDRGGAIYRVSYTQ
ncbi:sorbosone dehydrogenase family protein [uncultured Cocleimonas sp.]|uniref:PQQ-dependent sugar dehydrogenase n=1 Tax=uncultured Cocleimonas sp. TaxID=1051587 RepID=UPI00262F3852|nr:PQQ-dependent sugar dehydrogenase [uncultured Cocleimonas sp.]